MKEQGWRQPGRKVGSTTNDKKREMEPKWIKTEGADDLDRTTPCESALVPRNDRKKKDFGLHFNLRYHLKTPDSSLTYWKQLYGQQYSTMKKQEAALQVH